MAVAANAVRYTYGMEEQLPEHDDISSPSDFDHWLIMLRNRIKDGSLEQYWPPDAPFANKEKIEDGSPGGDYVEWYFKEPATGKRYKLSVETYHGSGGSWDILV